MGFFFLAAIICSITARVCSFLVGQFGGSRSEFACDCAGVMWTICVLALSLRQHGVRVQSVRTRCHFRHHCGELLPTAEWS